MSVERKLAVVTEGGISAILDLQRMPDGCTAFDQRFLIYTHVAGIVDVDIRRPQPRGAGARYSPHDVRVSEVS